MLEREFEDILAKYPELIEDGLILEERQKNVDRKFIDLFFKDRFGQNLIVELKAGIAKREHIGQLIDYAGYSIGEGKPPVRVMLIANRIPENFKHSFDYYGFEYKEITIDTMRQFLLNKNDRQSLQLFAADNEVKTASVSATVTPRKVNTGIEPILMKDKSERNETRHAMAARIKSGKFFNQSKYAIELLRASSKPVGMKEITSFMSTKGYHSKTYYDLFNALVDSELVEEVTLNGRKAYQLKKDD